MKDLKQIIVGRQAVSTLLANQPELVSELLLASDENVLVTQRLAEMAKKHDIKMRRVPKAQMEIFAKGAVHQGVAAILASSSYHTLEEVIAAAHAAGPNALILVADHIQDPHNLGALIRTAVAAGAQGVVIPKDRACQLTPAVSKAAAGTMNMVPICRVTNLSQALRQLREEVDIWSLAADTSGSPPPWELDLKRPLALIVGNEHQGVGQRLLDNCDMKTSLPLNGQVESLNASVAAGIVLFEIVRQRAGNCGVVVDL